MWLGELWKNLNLAGWPAKFWLFKIAQTNLRGFLRFRRRILSAAGGTQKYAHEVMQGKSGKTVF